MIYRLLRALFPTATKSAEPRRIVLIRTCCIGDAVMATAALKALREAYPKTQIAWAVGPWSERAIAHHPALDDTLVTEADMPLRSPGGFWTFVGQLRAGNYDAAVSLVRSPLMSLAVWLAGIPLRAGLDSGGRGFGYNLRVPLDPDAPEHESEIYLQVVNALAGRDIHVYANLPLTEGASVAVRKRLAAVNIGAPYIVAHPGGGVNPGARLECKRFPLQQLAATLNQVAEARAASVILLGGPGDGELVAEVQRRLIVPAVGWVDRLTFPEIGALAAEALLYIGNDSGLTHLAAASGAKTVMLMRPTDPRRYAPYSPDAIAVRVQGAQVRAYSVAKTDPREWDDTCRSVVRAIEEIVGG